MSETEKTKPAAAAEEIAEAILRIDQAMKQINQCRLKSRAIILLLQDLTGVPLRTIQSVLGGLDRLKSTYLKAP